MFWFGIIHDSFMAAAMVPTDVNYVKLTHT